VRHHILSPTGQYDPSLPLPPYLVQLADWAWSDYCRDGRIATVTAEISGATRGAGEEDPTRAARQLRDELRSAGFTDHEVEVLVRFYGADQSAGEIAQALGLSAKQVYAVPARLRTALCDGRCGIVQALREAGLAEPDTRLVAALLLANLEELAVQFRSEQAESAWNELVRMHPDLAHEIGRAQRTNHDLQRKVVQLRRRRLVRVAERLDEPVLKLVERFAALRQRPEWDSSDSLREHRRWLERLLEETDDWVRYLLSGAGTPAEHARAYMTLWLGYGFETVQKRSGLPYRQAVAAVAEILKKVPALRWGLPPGVRKEVQS
jgi:hypothetical protein